MTTVFTIVVVIICWLQLEISCREISHIFQMQWRYNILNMATIFLFLCFIDFIINNKMISGIICEIVCCVIAIINYYVIIFHGSPLSINELKSFTTAVNVMHSYKFAISIHVIAILVGLLAVIGSFVIFIYYFKKKRIESFRENRTVKLIFLLIASCFLSGAYFSKWSIKPQKTIVWSWGEAYYQYGYVACSVETVANYFNSIHKPEGYTDSYISEIEIKNEYRNSKAPDIILIINESFYDLSLIADIETNVDYMENINNLDNIITGYTVCPMIGGGTNKSEYEILTSNSLHLMPGITPFNVLDMTNANSINSHLKNLGYTTLAAHTEPAINYMRGTAYSAMEFDYIYFDEDFHAPERYGERGYVTDESVYKNLNNWYMEMPDAQPRFLYLLTIQNHAAYDLNPEECDIVKVEKGWSGKESEINEYLTCVYLSDMAFGKLVEYYQNIDREVVICMVGDHAPSLATEIIDNKYTDEEKNLLLRSTPFVIWSNYGLDEQEEGTISMNYLIPTVLQAAGIELSPYYEYLLELKQDIPILGYFDKYYDKDGKAHSYEEENEYSNMIKQYYYMEYNNLQKNRRQELFSPYGN